MPQQTIAQTYDATGNVLTRTITNTSTSQTRTWTYTYNSYGEILTENGPRTDVADVTTRTYYACTTGYQCGQVQTMTNALGQVTTYNSYNAHGQPLTITDPNGVVTTLTYDLRQRLTSRSVGGETTGFEYWPTGRLKKVTLSDSSFLQYTYDAAQRLTQIQDAAGNKVVYTLDAMGNRTVENLYDPSNALTRTHSRVYNSLNQLWKEIAAAGTASVTTVFGYDNNGNQTTINAPLTRNTANQYDELNRLKQVTDPANGVTLYGYDASDNLTSVTDPRGLITSYTYNGLGDLTTLVSPDTGTAGHTYDSGGNLKTRSDARNKTGTYSYDALNRLTQLAYSDQTLNFTYDAGTHGRGRLTGASDAQHALSWTYDALGRVTSKSQTVGGVTRTVGYGYTNGQLSSLTTPSGQSVVYGYSNGRIASITLNGAALLNNVLYDPFGPSRGWNWGNGQSSTRTYNLNGRVTSIDSAGAVTYGYHPDGAIASMTQDSSLNSGLALGATSLSVAAANNSLTGASGVLNRNYSYDAAGNMLSDGSRTFTYSDAGRLVSATVSGATTAYTYNALGQRVRKTNVSGTTYFVYDEAGHLLGEYGSAGSLIAETIWLGDIPVAVLKPNGSGGVNVFYIHTDHLNTPRKITEPATNQIVWRWDHDPYGNGAPNGDPDGNGQIVTFNMRFPGQYYDEETGLNYNYFRDYDPNTGRYVQSDPTGLKYSINTYAYLDADPLNGTDPLGLGRATGRPRPTTTTIGVGGCIGTACVEYESDNLTSMLLIPALPEFGGAFFYCMKPEKIPDDDCGPTIERRSKDTDFDVNFGMGRYLGVSLGSDGSMCINLGLGMSAPISSTFKAGPLWR